MASCSASGDSAGDSDNFRARNYQVELFEKACESNTIVCLKTGAGKTFIAVMLIKEWQHEILNAFDMSKRTVFIVPKVPLVEQQAKVIETHTSLSVGRYFGEMGVDFWSENDWRLELEKHHVLVMTAQILVNLLGTGTMSLNKINLLIFDECHAATGNHPYCAIMARYADFTDKPRILGLTAAVVNGKCPPSRVEGQMRKLEMALHCRIQSSGNLFTVSRFSTKPREVIIEFANRGESEADEAIHRWLNVAKAEMKPILEESKAENLACVSISGIFTFARIFGRSVDNGDSDELSEIFKEPPGPYVLINNVRSIQNTMGTWCTRLIVKLFLDKIPKWREDAEERLKRHFVAEYNILEPAFKSVSWTVENTLRVIPENQAIVEFTTPKLKRLLELLVNLNPDRNCYDGQQFVLDSFRCIVFVEERITAAVLCNYLRKIATVQPEKYGFLKPCFLVGHGCHVQFMSYQSMKVDTQSKVLNNFRSGKTNVMVATTVVEEGLDIPRCNVVIRFDPPKNFCSYVQSMGRARAESALYVLLVEAENRRILENELSTFKMIDEVLLEQSKGRCAPAERETEEFYEMRKLVESYYPKSKDGACVTMTSALSTLNMYTNSIPRDSFTTFKLRFQLVVGDDGRVSCTITMPTGPLLGRPVKGDRMPSLKEAKQAAGVNVCVLLHKAGELDDRLLPCMVYLDKYLAELGVVQNDDVLPGCPIPGTKKRRFVYDKVVADDLSNCQPKNLKAPVYLHVIRVVRADGGQKPRFAILSSKPISSVCPFTIFKETKYTVFIETLHPPFTLTKSELSAIGTFHQVLFGDVLRLVANAMTYMPNDAEQSFLVVPVVSSNNSNVDIDWATVSRCVNYKAGLVDERDFCVPEEGSVVEPLYGDASIRSKRFFVLAVERSLTPMSPFHKGGQNTFSSYFKTKYGVTISNDSQPLIHVYFAPNSISLLAPSKLTGNPRAVREMYLVPELCKILPVNCDSYQQAYFLPSIIHRLNGLLLTKQLVDQIVNEADIVDELTCKSRVQGLLEDVYNNCTMEDATIFVPQKEGPRELEASTLYALVFQALTTRSAANWNDLERLELIGDSYLKYIVTVYLFCEFSHVNEGYLSSLRTGLVKNATLCHFAKLKKIPEGMNTVMFQPRIKWLPPGYVIPKQLSRQLTDACIPAHLWPFATMDDVVVRQLHCNRNVWVNQLNNRWDETDYGIKEVAQQGIMDSYADLDDSDTEEQILQISYNHFTQQLIDDKTVADSTEAIIGAVLLSCGQIATLSLLKWLGFRLERRTNDENNPEYTAIDTPFPWARPKTALIKPVTANLMAQICSRLDVLEESLGYRFRDRSFLRQAVIHSSYTKHPATNNYQRLEFLGDAVLDFLITMNLYKKYPDMSPGDMTDLRSSLVDNTTFAFLTVKCEMHKHLRYNSFTLPQAIDSYLKHHSMLAHPKEAIYMYGEDEVLELTDIEVPKALGDLFESVAGAVFVDSGFDLEAVWRVFHPILKDLIHDYATCLPINPVRKLLEHFPSATFGNATRFEDSKNFTVKVEFNGQRFIGRGRTKAVAKQAAAKCALRAQKLTSYRKLNL